MAFDINTAKEDTSANVGGFDINSAVPEDQYTPKDMVLSAAAPSEIALTMGTGGLSTALGGLAGLVGAALPGDEGQGAEVSKWVQDTFTYQPRTKAAQDILGQLAPIGEFFQDLEQGAGDIGYESTGYPLVGALASTIPAALSEVPILKGPKAAARAARIRSAKLADEAAELRKSADDIEVGSSEVAEVIKKGDEADIQAVVDADPEFYQSADALGINTEPLASYASKNPQYRGVEQGLAAIPESALNAQGKAFVADISKRADDLIEEYGGTKDKAMLSDEFRSDSIARVDDLADQADKLYDKLDMAIAKNTKVETPNAAALFSEVADDFGGVDNMPKVYKDIRNRLITEDMPTFAQLDFARREVGQAINKRSGQFKDAESGALKRLYANLRKDQDLIAEKAGVKDISDAANGLIRQRKQIEDNLVNLIGKDMSGSITTKSGQAIKQLAKGDAAKWDNLISKLPKSARERVAASALSDLFAGSGSGQKGFSANNFVKAYEDLNRNKAAKTRLMKELPDRAKADLDNLFKLSKGVDTALKDKIPTGMVSRFFDQNNGLVKRLLGQGAGMIATAKGGPLAGTVVADILSGSGGAAKTTSDMLGSAKFQSIIRKAVSDGVQDGAKKTKSLEAAEKVFSKSNTYKKWAGKLDETSKQQLATQGLIGYLFSEEEENDNYR